MCFIIWTDLETEDTLIMIGPKVSTLHSWFHCNVEVYFLSIIFWLYSTYKYLQYIIEWPCGTGSNSDNVSSYTINTEILQRAIQDVQVQSNSKRRAQLTSKRNDAIAKADSLKKTMSEKRYIVISLLCVRVTLILPY